MKGGSQFNSVRAVGEEKNFGALTSNNPIVHGMVSIGVEVSTYVSYYLRTIVTIVVGGVSRYMRWTPGIPNYTW